MLDSSLCYLAYASGAHGAHPGAALAAQSLQQLMHSSSDFQWDAIIEEETQCLPTTAHAIHLNQKLSLAVEQCIHLQKKFVVIGGDHTCALGTWSGASYALSQQPLGMIWIDAHLDAHTPDTSPSNNLHGMPMAALLGHGIKEMTALRHKHPKIASDRLVYIGTRSFEPEERALLDSLSVRIFDVHDIQQLGLSHCITEALKITKADQLPYGISLDLDVFDPKWAPGVSCRVAQGLNPKELMASWPQHAPQPVGMEIVELNPLLDNENTTVALIPQLVGCFMR